MPPLTVYLEYRTLFLKLGKTIEVQQLDIYYKLNFLYDINGRLIKIIRDD